MEKNKSSLIGIKAILVLVFVWFVFTMFNSYTENQKRNICVQAFNDYFSSITDTVQTPYKSTNPTDERVTSLENQEKETRKLIDRQIKFTQCIYSR